METVIEKLENQNIKLIAMMQDLADRVSRIESPSGQPASKLARRKSEPQLTARNLQLGLGSSRRLSFRRRTSLHSNVTSLSATSALSDERGFPMHITARRPSHLTDTTDLTEDFEDFEVVDYENGPPQEKTDSPLVSSPDRLYLSQSPERLKFGDARDSPSSTGKSLKIMKSDDGNSANTPSPSTGILAQQAGPKVSSLAKLWQISGPSFETIHEEEGEMNRSTQHDQSDVSTTSETNASQKASNSHRNSSKSSYDSEIVDSRLRVEYQSRGSSVLANGAAGPSEFVKGLPLTVIDESQEVSIALGGPVCTLKSEDEDDNTVADDVDSPYTLSPFIEKEIIPINEGVSIMDDVVEEIISIIQPHEEQLSLRGSVQAMVTRFARRLVGTKLMETGLHAIRCFLPDDALRLGLFLPPSSKQNGTWASILCDKFLKLSEGDLVTVDDFEDMKLSSFFADANTLSILGDHAISNVTTQVCPPPKDPTSPSTPTPPQTPQQTSHFFPTNLPSNVQRVYLTLDSVQIEIVANPKLDIVTLALLEELSDLVGKNLLFKRSLLVIRAWWMYETSAYVGSPIKHYLSDLSVAIMVGALFNQYHARLHHPLQALTMFLAEYAHISWETHAISLQGVIPFHEPGGNEPVFKRISRSHLLTLEILQKYLEALYLVRPTESPGPRDSPSMSTGARSTGNNSHHSSHSHRSHHSQPHEVALGASSDDVSQEEYACESNVNHVKLFRRFAKTRMFEKGNLNVVHPLTLTNMIQKNYISSRRMNKIARAFETGAKSLSTTLKLAVKGSVSVHMPLNSFFRGICSRFGTGWRPDVIANTLVLSIGMVKQKSVKPVKGKDSRDAADVDLVGFAEKLKSHLTVSLSTLWSQVHYCNLLLHGRVTDDAVIFFCKDILQERGALPVGEVGKILQDTTAAFQLSTRLKEKYGGLKKFLELHESEFVMSQEHPFNPHVLIRKALTPEDFEFIAKNVIPPAYSSKHKKLFLMQSRKLKAAGAVLAPPSTAPDTVSQWGPLYQDPGQMAAEKLVTGSGFGYGANRRGGNQQPQHHSNEYYGGRGSQVYGNNGRTQNNNMYDRGPGNGRGTFEQYPDRHFHDRSMSMDPRYDRGIVDGGYSGDRRFDGRGAHDGHFTDFRGDYRQYDNRNIHEAYPDLRYDRGTDNYFPDRRFDRGMADAYGDSRHASTEFYMDPHTSGAGGLDADPGYHNRYHEPRQVAPDREREMHTTKYPLNNAQSRGRTDGNTGMPIRGATNEAVPIPDRIPFYSSRDRPPPPKTLVNNISSTGKITPTSVSSMSSSQSIPFKSSNGTVAFSAGDVRVKTPNQATVESSSESPPGLAQPINSGLKRRINAPLKPLETQFGADDYSGGSLSALGATPREASSLSYSSMFMDSGQANNSLIDQLLGNSLNESINFDALHLR
jgi:hypothetical protein